MESTKDQLTKEQQASLENLYNFKKDRQSADMHVLLKMPEFLRWVGRWTQECGCNQAISSNESRDASFREGKRYIGEMMLAQIKQCDLEKKFEMERLIAKDESIRRSIINEGRKFQAVDVEK